MDEIVISSENPVTETKSPIELNPEEEKEKEHKTISNSEVQSIFNY